VSQSGAKRDNSQYRVRLPKSVSFPIADAFEGGSQRNVMSHRDKIEAVAVRCALRQPSVAKMPLTAPQVLLAVRMLLYSAAAMATGLAVAVAARIAVNRYLETARPALSRGSSAAAHV
jgi:hypothetical protein